LGLHMGGEEPLPPERLAALAAAVAGGVDLERLLALAAGAPAPETDGEMEAPAKEGKVRIGIARDPAFCFYYEDNLDLLAAAGAELVFFSPLADERLPAGVAALYLGGGYPEMYAGRLASNRPLLAALRQWAEAGRPLYAECGGFMALTEGIEDREGRFHPMAGIFPVRARMRPRRTALGYREVRLRQAGLFGPAGTCLRGHEFRYSETGPMPAAIERMYEGEAAGYRYKNVEAGYVHLHLGSNRQAATAFVDACRGDL
jgi:cobyrinic acid a,c-diamide synthase